MRGNKHLFLSTESSLVTFWHGVLVNFANRELRFQLVHFNIYKVLNFPFLYHLKNVFN